MKENHQLHNVNDVGTCGEVSVVLLSTNQRPAKDIIYFTLYIVQDKIFLADWNLICSAQLVRMT